MKAKENIHISAWAEEEFPVKSHEVEAVTSGEKTQKCSVTEAQWEEYVKNGVDNCQILQKGGRAWGMKRHHMFLKMLCFNFHLQKIKEILQVVKMLKNKYNETTRY